jgi:hypothetical protein
MRESGFVIMREIAGRAMTMLGYFYALVAQDIY